MGYARPDVLVETSWVGREVMLTRPRCALLALDTLKIALREYRRHLPKKSL
jgi:NifU-like protein involved in Fe-S cluster formation